MLLVYLFTILIYFISNIQSDEILGCGGFIKSDVQLDFSRVSIKLFTKTGSLKDTTECAPNNGYYFIPLYDKGDYVLKVEPPTGWSFDKTEIELNVDGESDPCSLGKDINFYFKGFGITGRVYSADSDNGPVGVKISYIENGKTRETYTTDGGNFYFTPVVPGRYTILASHPRWKFLKNSITVDVKIGNTELPADSFIVAGYDVTGHIMANNEPIEGVNIILVNDKLTHVVAECNVHPIPNFHTNLGKPMCHIKSDNTGTFKFVSLPPGDYKIVPYYQENNVKFEIQPHYIEFNVKDNSVDIDTKFHVTGLTVSGRVLLPKDNQGATVIINNEQKTITGVNGQYTLNNIRSGSYRLTAQAPDIQFPELKVDIMPRKHTLPDLKPNAYKSCGQVLSDTEYDVLYELQPNKDRFTVKSNAKSGGNYCLYLPPGQYEAKVLPSVHDPPNVQFYPLTHHVEIVDKTPADIVFSQLRATVTGVVECFTSTECESLQIDLKSMSTGSPSQIYKTIISNGKYKFSDIPPGRYEVSIIGVGLCWEGQKHYIVINSEEAAIPTFKQTGYRTVFRTDYLTQINYELLSESNSIIQKGTIDNPPGTNTHCLKKAGRYRFTGVSCHGYDPKFVEWSTSSRSNIQTPIVFTAITHAHNILVTVNDKNAKISLNVKSEDEELLYTLSHAKITPISENKLTHEFSLQVGEHEVLIIEPQSDVMLFKPKSLRLVGSFDCVKLAGEILALKGRILAGKIVPPLSGVQINVAQLKTHSQIATSETKADGVYRFGPLDNDVEYLIKASKENYYFEGPDANGNFKAHKMADIKIAAIDPDNQENLAGVLVSVSGGDNYRKNLQTTVNGVAEFTSLNPGEYFMRPMMKEYRFEPNSKMITVKEGESFSLVVHGKRVAFSAFGTVRSLGGTGEPGVLVEARAMTSSGKCDGHTEEATTDITGGFRIRGLLPGCSYHLQLKHQSEMSSPIAFDNIQHDLHNIQLICLQPPSYVDVTVHVYTPKLDDYKSLRVKLGYGDELSQPIQSLRIDPQLLSQRKTPIPKPGLLVVLNSVPYDGKQYYVQLESSLSQASHTYDVNTIYFYANTSFKHVYLDFYPHIKSPEYEISPISILGLPLLFLLIFVIFIPNKFLEFTSTVHQYAMIHINNFMNNAGGANASNPKQSGNVKGNVGGGSDNDYPDIEQIVQNINAVKHKPKKRVLASTFSRKQRNEELQKAKDEAHLKKLQRKSAKDLKTAQNFLGMTVNPIKKPNKRTKGISMKSDSE